MGRLNINELKKFQESKNCTLLCIGPMSKNCVDATIDISNSYEVPIFLIASRRQIDSSEFGGGYVNNWNTREFSDYVKKNDKKELIFLARDHGGPWQNPIEVKEKMSLVDAMKSAKRSFQEDIINDFSCIHLDPSITLNQKLNTEEIIERLNELYEFCWGVAKAHKKDIIFEIGTEEQSGGTNTAEELEYVIKRINDNCTKHNLPKPTFVVVQMGTKVVERRNIGSIDCPVRLENEISPEIQIPKMIEICNRNNILVKSHNTDYLSSETLNWHPKLGIHAANVAPEFGVTETLSMIKTLRENYLDNICDEILDLALQSKKWEKWLRPNSRSNDEEKAIIACHYIFSNKNFLELKEKAKIDLLKRGINLDQELKNAVFNNIKSYLRSFNLI